jgi:hypothetical protein
VKIGEPTGTAEPPPAATIAVNDFGFVAGANLSHFYARAKCAYQISNQVSKVNALFCREKKQQF